MHTRINVVDIELSQPIAPITCSPHYSAAKALLRLHGTPVGYLDLPLSHGRCSAEAIIRAALDQHGTVLIAHQLDRWLQSGLPSQGLDASQLAAAPIPAPAELPLPFVTVAVCTRNRPDDLARCLEAIAELDYPSFEVVVVDNAPSDNRTERLVRARFPQMRYVREPRPGLDWARNRAITEARGEIVAYTDDDVMVDRGWVSALARVFAEDASVMAVTGLVVPFELENATQILFEKNGGFGRGFVRKRYQADPADGPVGKKFAWSGMFGTGANMAYRRSLFAQIDGFDPALDVGTCTNGGGDIEMFFRVIKEGFPLVYEPAAMVRHRHRRDYASFARQMANNGVGFSAYLVRTALAYPDERLTIARFWLVWLARWLCGRLWASLRGREDFPRHLIVAEIWGFLVGAGRYQRARRRAAEIALHSSAPAEQLQAKMVVS